MDPAPWSPKQGDGGGPRSPDISRPDTKDLLKKMRKVDPNQSKRYRQRTGQ
ncbi:MAG: ubiquitin-like protein UBact [Verrucomicrobiota bacterium]